MPIKFLSAKKIQEASLWCYPLSSRSNAAQEPVVSQYLHHVLQLRRGWWHYAVNTCHGCSEYLSSVPANLCLRLHLVRWQWIQANAWRSRALKVPFYILSQQAKDWRVGEQRVPDQIPCWFPLPKFWGYLTPKKLWSNTEKMPILDTRYFSPKFFSRGWLMTINLTNLDNSM